MDEVIIIMGANGGLGQGIDSYLSRRVGAEHICLVYGKKGCDIRQEAAVERFFDDLKVKAPGDAIHIVIATGFSKSAMLHKTTFDDVRQTFLTNTLGPMNVLKYARLLLKVNGGSVTILSSICAERPVAGTGAYAASKAALHGLVKVAALEMAPFARVNAIELGYFNVGMIVQTDPGSLLGQIPMKRLGTCDEVGHAVEFCIGATYLTGSVVKLAGGL